MTRSARLVGVAGIATASVGVVLVLVPGVAVGLTTSDIVVSVLGVLALGQGARAVLTRRGGDARWATTPDPETRTETSPPGVAFDAALDRRDPTVRDRLRNTAVAVLTRVRECTDAEAREQLDHGQWTDDRQAAAFFAADVGSERGRRPTRIRGDPPVVDQAHRVVAALDAIVQKQSGGHGGDADGTGQRDAAGGSPVGRDGSHVEQAPARADGAVDPDVRRPAGGEVTDRRTGRWRGVAAFALVAVAVGVLAGEPSLLLVGTVGVAVTGYAAYGRAGAFESLTLDLERRVAAGYTTPGDDVPLVVRVTNRGDRPLVDLRIVDGVPPELVVVDGTPRHATALRPGETASFTYTVRAEHGQHEFEPAVVIARDPTGERERVTRIGGDGDPIRCRIPPRAADDLSLRSHTTEYVGRVQTDDRGGGTEFFSTREYRPSDPLASIDWKRLARTRELATIEFREEHLAKVMLVVDARSDANLATDWHERSAVAASVEAADVLVHTLLDANNRVGITTFTAGRCWLPPGSGSEHQVRASQLLASQGWPASHVADGGTENPFVVSVELARLRRRLPDDAQAIVLSPLGDGDAVSLVRRLEADGTPVTVLSPDPTTELTPGRRLARIERRVRIDALRAARIPVYEWPIDESLALATSQARQEVTQ